MKITPTCVQEDSRVCWQDMSMLQTEADTTYKNYEHKELAHMSLIEHPVGQPNLAISPSILP